MYKRQKINNAIIEGVSNPASIAVGSSPLDTNPIAIPNGINDIIIGNTKLP